MNLIYLFVARFVVKMDDDVFFNPVNLIHFLDSSGPDFDLGGRGLGLHGRAVYRYETYS